MPGGSEAAPHAELAQALAWQHLAAGLALDTGALLTAHAWLTARDRLLDWSGAMLGQAEGQLGWAAYQRTMGDAALAYQHAERALAHATEPRQPLALLAARRLLGELDTAEGHHAEAQAHLDAALAVAEACAPPYERALTLLALAELRAATGDRVAARVALEEARAICAPLGAAPVPPAPALPFGLTAREADVPRLVVEGLPDAQIAARLFVGRSTVNSHLKAIYGRLGVSTRAACLALDHGLR